jgi:AAA domain
MLTIVRASDPMPVEQLVVCVYAAPGLGKTTLGFTAEKPLLLDFDNGAHRAGNRKDTVKVGSWADIEQMTKGDFTPFKTLIVDTAGRALDVLSLDIMQKNPKHGRGSGALSLAGFGELKARFLAWLTLIRSFKLDIILVCHMSEERNGDDLIERIDAQGASKNEIYKSSDAMCRILMRGRERVLSFDPREGGFGKNPAQLPELIFRHPSQDPQFLAGVLTRIKQSINQLTEESRQAQTEAEGWLLAIREVETLDTVNRMLPEVKKAAKTVQKAFADRAKALGFSFNKEKGLYIPKAA